MLLYLWTSKLQNFIDKYKTWCQKKKATSILSINRWEQWSLLYLRTNTQGKACQNLKKALSHKLQICINKGYDQQFWQYPMLQRTVNSLDYDSKRLISQIKCKKEIWSPLVIPKKTSLQITRYKQKIIDKLKNLLVKS